MHVTWNKHRFRKFLLFLEQSGITILTLAIEITVTIINIDRL